MKPFFVGLLFCLSLTNCSKSSSNDPHNEQQQPPASEKGYVTGKVTDTKGNPIAGVKVYIDNTIFYNSGMSTTTDAKGNYKIKAEPGSYRAYAEMNLTFNNHPYKIQFHPDNYDSFSGLEGAVRNFQWKLTGERPFNTGTYYGGFVSLSKDPDSDMGDAQNIEFTFTPQGNLIDGSAGTTIVRSCGEPYSQTYYYIMDIPIGRYKVTAKYKPTGKSLKLRNGRNYEGSFADAVTLDFYGTDAPVGAPNNMYVTFTDK